MKASPPVVLVLVAAGEAADGLGKAADGLPATQFVPIVDKYKDEEAHHSHLKVQQNSGACSGRKI